MGRALVIIILLLAMAASVNELRWFAAGRVPHSIWDESVYPTELICIDDDGVRYPLAECVVNTTEGDSQ